MTFILESFWHLDIIMTYCSAWVDSIIVIESEELLLKKHIDIDIWNK